MSDLYGRKGRILQDLRALEPALRATAIAAMRWIARDPQPDGLAKRAAPHRVPGTVEAVYDRLLIVYVLDRLGVVFLRVQRIEIDDIEL